MNSEIETFMNLPEISSDSIWIHETYMGINRCIVIFGQFWHHRCTLGARGA